MNCTLQVSLLLGLLTSCILASPLKFEPKCTPGDNCKAPDCRCWDDPKPPGNLEQGDIPPMVLLTFDYAFNNHTVQKYLDILKSMTNPNKCPAKATFFIQAFNSDSKTLHGLYKDHHELALNSERGIIPTSEKEWKDSFQYILDMLKEADVPLDGVKGVRTPELFAGGNDQFEAMQNLSLSYDDSCVTVEHSDPQNLLWPYTCDYVDSLPRCSTGHTVTKAFPGVWEFPVPTLKFNNRHCPTPSGCMGDMKTSDDVFQLFFNSFNDHYQNNRSPFVIDIDANWVTNEMRVEATVYVLQYISFVYKAWILTMSQALEWIKDPVPLGSLGGYKPWDCADTEKRTRLFKQKNMEWFGQQVHLHKNNI